VAVDAAFEREIRRVGKNAVEAALGVFGGDGVEEFEAVAVVEPRWRAGREVRTGARFSSRGSAAIVPSSRSSK
jgi:hypothetical protein